MTDEPSSGIVLIVDDTPTNLEVLFETLSADGFKVLVAIDGEGALEQAALTRPDVILLDVMMPDIDGFETCRRLKAVPETADIPIIFMTALSDTVDKVRGFELGAVDYITKPFQQREVSVRVTTHIKISKLQDEIHRANVRLEQANEYLEQRIAERMVDLAEANVRLRKLNRAFRRFVPQEFLHLLGHEDVAKIELGHQVEIEATLMFVGIRGFNRKTAGLNPGARLDFLNRYMACVAPSITEHNGFVDKYVGDAVMALFPHATSDAVEAADAIHIALAQFRADTNHQIQVGIGLHCGPMLLGTIGAPERMDTTMISDVVDCTAKLERLTKRYAVGTLLSGPMRELLEEDQRKWTRKIAQVRFDGSNQTMDLFELFSSDPTRDLKLKTRPVFEQALSAYEISNFTQACKGFEMVVGENSSDNLAQRLFRRSQKLLGEGAPAGWSGVYQVPSVG